MDEAVAVERARLVHELETELLLELAQRVRELVCDWLELELGLVAALVQVLVAAVVGDVVIELGIETGFEPDVGSVTFAGVAVEVVNAIDLHSKRLDEADLDLVLRDC